MTSLPPLGGIAARGPMQRRRMRRLGILRSWGLVLLLLSAAASIDPACAQQSAPTTKPKPKPEATPKPAAPATRPVTPAAAVAGGAQTKLLGQYGVWGAYTATPGGKKICFVLAKPTASETNPPNRPRNPVYMFISTRPADKVTNEVSLVVGYPFKSGTEAMAQDGAWIKNAAEEAKMVDAMRSGDSAVIKGVSAKGTQSTDTFTLKGVSQALDRAGQECK